MPDHLQLVELYPNKTLPPEPVEIYRTPCDEEIKKYIDNKEAVTQTELVKFIYGYYSGKRSPRVSRWWAYIIETKDPVKLRQYSIDKQFNGSRDPILFEQVKATYKKDSRLQQYGVKLGVRLLKTVYGIDIAITTYRNYLKQIKTL